MNVRESASVALGALRANALRSFLTLLGVIVGVSSAIAVISLVQGLNHYVSGELMSSGSNVFTIDKFGTVFDFVRVLELSRRRDLRPEDAEAVARGSHVAAAVAERSGTVTVKRGSRSLRQVAFRGMQDRYMEVEDLPVAQGRPLGAEDQRSRAAVCVIGDEVAEQLFESRDPIGAELRVGRERMVVVGLGAKKGSSFGASQDLYVLVPFGALARQFGRIGSVDIHVKSGDLATFVQAQDEARALLRIQRHLRPGQPDDFEITTPEMLLSVWHNVSGAIFIVIVGVSLISLLVGGIVIMNIMLVSVTERTREIGIRKALGARRRDILMQFLVEAATLSTVGGILGLALGILIAVAIGMLTPLPTYVSPIAVLLGLVVSTVVGVFFGAYPAARAARQDPIEALRWE